MTKKKHNIETCRCTRCGEIVGEYHIGCCGYLNNGWTALDHVCKETSMEIISAKEKEFYHMVVLGITLILIGARSTLREMNKSDKEAYQLLEEVMDEAKMRMVESKETYRLKK